MATRQCDLNRRAQQHMYNVEVFEFAKDIVGEELQSKPEMALDVNEGFIYGVPTREMAREAINLSRDLLELGSLCVKQLISAHRVTRAWNTVYPDAPISRKDAYDASKFVVG